MKEGTARKVFSDEPHSLGGAGDGGYRILRVCPLLLLLEIASPGAPPGTRVEDFHPESGQLPRFLTFS